MTLLKRPDRAGLMGGLLVSAIVFVSACANKEVEPLSNLTRDPAPHATEPQAPDAAPARYVGTAVCSSCHANVAKAHRGSDHDRAIEIPARDTVLAPFAGETFAHDGVTTTFSQSGGDYFVKTRGVDGKLQSFRVAYTFGYRPLQQYLLDFGDGRLQAFTVAWDARPPGQGGQRYFSLYPGERLVPSDELHWTRFTQNWNFTCADCHSTEFKKGYDQAKDTFASNFVELDVGCEACHGPGSHHLSWTADAKAADPTKGLVIQLERAAAWTIPPGARSAIPRSVGDNLHELETCAPCHARRQQLREGRRVNEPFLDAYLPDLLISPLYQHDGQVDDEVYIYGSFLQSRMFHAGVRCSDCHDSHSLKLRRPGNALCTGCHDAGTFDSVAHHHHPGKRGGECVSCHMPQKTYMQVDPRHDHSIRIPRPDLGPSLGTTDPCTGCHEDRTQAWAAGRISDWFGPTRRDHYGATLHAAQLREPGAEASLIELTQKSAVPAIVRATALLLLQNYPTATSRAALHVGARSEESLLRLGAAEGARGLAPGQRLEVILRLLTDPLLAVRTAAARTIADVPPSQFPSSTQATIKRTVEELRKTERYNADRPDAWLRVALIDAGRGDLDQAVRSLEQALKLDARFVPALVNLADVRRLQQNETEAETLLRRALGVDPLHAEAWHALGLSLVRQKRTAEGVSMLKRAFELRPQNARLAYVYAVALGDGGDIAAAIRVLRRSLEQHPHDPTLIQTLMNYAQKAGDAGLTQEMAARLVALRAAQAGAVQ